MEHTIALIQKSHDGDEKAREQLVEENDITLRAKKRADEIMRVTEQNVKDLKLGTFDYIDDVLYNFQEKIAAKRSFLFCSPQGPPFSGISSG